MGDVALDEWIAHQLSHDLLTGLPNRTLFLERLGAALARADSDAPSIAVMFLDLDNFRFLNDSLGHGAGDRLLVALARRIQTVLHDHDTVARFGGDEFLIACEGLRTERDAIEVARRITNTVALPFLLAEGEVYVTVSIGIAMACSATDRPDALLRDADLALHQAKERGRSRIELFDEIMRTRSLTRLETDKDLRRGLVDWQYRVVYQPEVRLDTGAVVGFEALLRWEHPERGLLGPGEFLAVAEETGLIVPIGAWLLGEACRQLVRWREAMPDAPPMQMSVNLSGRELVHPDLVARVAQVLAETGIDPGLLCLEITESVLLDDAEAAITILRRLRSLGVRLSVDDFGTGYSSLGYLKRLPVDSVKVDRSFVSGLGFDSDDLAIVTAVVSMAHALGLTVVAEGVETADQLRELEALGCDAAQGYYFARPQSARAITELVRRPLRWPPGGRSRLVS